MSMVMMMLLLAMHSQSRGALALTQTGEGIAVRIELATADLPELCGSVPVNDDERTACGQRAPLLKLRVGGQPCQLSPVVTTVVSPDIHLTLNAHCPTATGDGQLDWGLFASTELQHIAVTELRHLDGRVDRTLLTRQANRFVFELRAPSGLYGFALPAALVLAVMMMVIVLVWRRAR